MTSVVSGKDNYTELINILKSYFRINFNTPLYARKRVLISNILFSLMCN